MNNPIVIIGMHRSGTTLISKFLESIGVFLGEKKDENNEAIFFLNINRWIFSQINASWDNPYNFKFIDDYFEKKTSEYVKFVINSLMLIKYLGFKKYLKYRSLSNLDIFWGWKDPRTIFTISIWKRLFPNLKIIHIYRNPIDVASSLQKREISIRNNFKINLKMKVNALLFNKKIPYIHSARCINLDEGIKLWTEYMNQVLVIEKLYKEDFLSIKYEDLFDNPEQNLQDILSFLGLGSNNKSKLQNFIVKLDKSRKYAFLNDKTLVKKYITLKDNELIKYFGYGDII